MDFSSPYDPMVPLPQGSIPRPDALSGARPKVRVLLFNGEGQVAIGIRNDPDIEPLLEVIGGNVEPGETWDEAMHREVMEEIGRDVEAVKGIPRSIIEHCWITYPDGSRRTHTVMAIVARIVAHEIGAEPDYTLARQNDELNDCKWMRPEEVLQATNVTPYTRTILERYRPLWSAITSEQVAHTQG